MPRLFKFMPERSSAYASASGTDKATMAFSAGFSMELLIDRLQPGRWSVKRKHACPSTPSDIRFLSDYMLRDIGLTRADVLFGEFSGGSRRIDR